MKYTFNYQGKNKTVNVPQEYIDKNKRSLGITTTEAIHLWLYDNGYEENSEANALGEKAEGVRISNSTKKRKKKEPDIIKRSIVNALSDCIAELQIADHALGTVNIINGERNFTFSVDDEVYEVTLSKKRKPKNL